MQRRRSRRDPAKERFWQGTLREQVESGQSVRAFCRERQLTEAAFYFWRRELKLRDRERSTTSTGQLKQREARKQAPRADCLASDAKKKPNAKGSALFVPVVAAPLATTTTATVEMILPSGSVLRWPGGDVTTMAEVIAALEARLC